MLLKFLRVITALVKFLRVSQVIITQLGNYYSVITTVSLISGFTERLYDASYLV